MSLKHPPGIFGKDSGAGGESMLWLGTQMAEVEALFALVLAAPTLLVERRALGELSEAAERLAHYTRTAATRAPLWHNPGIRVVPHSVRARRRAVIAQRGADLIIMWAARST